MANAQSQTALLTKLVNPFLQAAIVLGLILLFDIGSGFLESAGVEMKQDTPWVIAATFILFFAMFNAILSLLADNMDKYWTRSMLSYVAVAGVAGLLAWAFSSQSINEAGTFRWIYIVLTFGYLLFLSMIGAMRKIVDFAQREEWNQPKIRKRKKK
jgi:hypothetical protein